MDYRGLQRLWRGAVRDRRDEVIALDAAFKGGPGILQIAGTGSNTIGRAPDGQRESAGGWSSHLGDEGSGYWIGLHSVRRALHAYDAEQPNRILEKVGEAWGTPDLEDLVNVGDGTPDRILPRWRRSSMLWPRRAIPSRSTSFAGLQGPR